MRDSFPLISVPCATIVQLPLAETFESTVVLYGPLRSALLDTFCIFPFLGPGCYFLLISSPCVALVQVPGVPTSEALTPRWLQVRVPLPVLSFTLTHSCLLSVTNVLV
jgi:hypothetical protein